MTKQLSGTPWFKQVQLLVRLLPLVSEEPCFALKGGTAINLFVRDLPRLSVDIDLAYLPLQPRDKALPDAKAALGRIAKNVNAQLACSAHMQSNRVDELRILVSNQGVQVKIEVSPVARGTLLPPVEKDVTVTVEDTFGFASIAVVNLPDLYGGKICAALDRQHPRDLFDIKLLMEAGELDRSVFEGFMVYLLGHPRPMSELLDPHFKPLQPVFDYEFSGMTLTTVSEQDLLNARNDMLEALRSHCTAQDAQFLLSVKRKYPDWTLFQYPEAANLPAVKWKMINIEKMPGQQHQAALQKLEAVLDKWCP
ncbi:nucleotidyl transferase AbiEii/AbiGii toxin family protein [Sansalvadorimonas verongulae]|uniref:nucleotidyl transferase AbiEii/AbiGii toxin family protein n=1 Tax=Sansalvadorimonas verongulae TaxID=2172824 RepID=UPI001E2F8B80|nr:nucleotidyl transferase AbiEii/AbiGii toxin family protein [Sansalvadorimonas verongulae]